MDRLFPGDKLRSIPAETWNRFVAAAEFAEGERGSGVRSDAGVPSGIMVKNNSGGNIDRFEVLSLASATSPIDPSTHLASWKQQVLLQGGTPGGSGEFFAIALEPIKSGGIGLCAVAGACWVKINVGSSGHTYATTGTVTTKLTSTSTANGSVRIVWKESGTGDKWAFVQLPIIDAVTGGRDINYFRQVGTSPFNVVYGGGSITGNNTATTNALADTIQATAFLAPRGGTLDAIKIWLATNGSAGSLTRLALYKATSETNLYPDALLVDSGDLASDAGAAGYLGASISATLDAGALYWICINTKNVATKPVVGGISDVYLFNILGYSATAWTPYFGLSLSRAYGSYPATFPASASPANGTFAIPTVHFSA